MDIWPFFLLGLIGGLHCVAMCGPLVLALPSAGGNRLRYIQGRLIYNGGRVACYAALGGLFGGLGQIAGLAGLQRWVSLAAGAILLAGLIAPSRFLSAALIARPVTALKSRLGPLLRSRSKRALLTLGLLNGLLPCGLVYVAAAGAAAGGKPVKGMEQMLAFGLGTIPLMLTLSLVGRPIQGALRLKARWLIPISAGLVAALLIVRGLALGVPYLSPRLLSEAVCGFFSQTH